jgi:hypothetical protein
MKDLQTISQEIFETEFGSETGIGVSETSISGWLQANLGKLNVQLYSCFSGDNSSLDDEAADIHKGLYMYDYYQKQSVKALRGVLDASLGDSILEVREGDSYVKRANKNEMAKTFRSVANDYKSDVDMMVGRYHILMSEARQVVGEDGF